MFNLVQPLPPAIISFALNLTVTTTTDNETFTLRCGDEALNWDAIIDWDDGSTSHITNYDDPDLTHLYATAGDHTLSITGDLPRFTFNNQGDKNKVKSLDSWGENVTEGVNVLYFTFYGCSNLLSVAGGSFQESEILGSFCFNCIKLTSVGLIHAPNATSMEQAFRNCQQLTTFPSGMDTSNISIFKSAFAFSGLVDFPWLDTSSATNFQGTFNGCTSLVNFPPNMFDNTTCTNFINAWLDTNLTSESKDNILVSLDLAGQSGGTLNITGGEAPGSNGLDAWTNLQSKGWTGEHS